MPDEIRILLAEDSATVRRYLISIIEETPGMRVVGEARNGDEVIKMVADLQPDVVSMDIKMPEMDGLEATRRIMASNPTPVVVVSGMLEVDVQLSLQALEAGALAVVGKPPDRKNPAYAAKVRELVMTLRAMAGVKVIARRAFPRPTDETQESGKSHEPQPAVVRPEIIAIGASTGGPSALNRLLKGFPADLSVPIVLVQHMPHEFIPGLARWLDNTTPLRFEIARSGLALMPGTVTIAPGTAHLALLRRGNGLVARLLPDDGTRRYVPSVDVLFDSVAKICGGAAIGVVLTGMGDDGAKGLLAMRTKGAYTFVQDEASCTVFGMPRAAIEKQAAQHIESLENLATKITKLI
jgi:two-component system chemotaxis response regulator CheB